MNVTITVLVFLNCGLKKEHYKCEISCTYYKGRFKLKQIEIEILTFICEIFTSKYYLVTQWVQKNPNCRLRRCRDRNF